MSFIPQITCKRCGKKYPGIRKTCPACGASRVVPAAASVGAAPRPDGRPAPATSTRANSSLKWQFIFGCIILAAIMLAVIFIIVISLGKSEETADPQKPQDEIVETTPTPTPIPTPTPMATPEPTPTVTSISITFFGSALGEEITLRQSDGDLDLDAAVYPVETVATVTWRSTNEDVCSVTQDGVISYKGSGLCSIIAECGAVSKELKVRCP